MASISFEPMMDALKGFFLCDRGAMTRRLAQALWALCVWGNGCIALTRWMRLSPVNHKVKTAFFGHFCLPPSFLLTFRGAFYPATVLAISLSFWIHAGVEGEVAAGLFSFNGTIRVSRINRPSELHRLKEIFCLTTLILLFLYAVECFTTTF